jgi:ATP-dependent Lon protease
MTDTPKNPGSSMNSRNESVHLPEHIARLPILPLRNTIAFPLTAMPLAVGIQRSIKLVENAMQNDRLIGLAGMKDPTLSEPMPGQIHETGTVARIEHVVKGADNGLQIIVQGIERFTVESWDVNDIFLRANVKLAPDIVEADLELDALQRTLREIMKTVIELSPNIPDELWNMLQQVEDPRRLTYQVAGSLAMEPAEGQKLLEANHLKQKIKHLIALASHEREVLTLGQKIQTEARGEMDKAQREYYLRQQLRAIRKELGETDEERSPAAEYEEKFEQAGLPPEAEKEARRELKRLSEIPPQAAEYAVIKTYLDWLLDLPWKKVSQDDTDVRKARKVLDEDHYDLEEIKERIIEYLAVRKRVQEQSLRPKPEDTEEKANAMTEALGVILCFAGPPGVGKTSLGQSIARALGRKFTRMSLGGMRDEAEIRGHRRTYIGAMPGRIIQGIKRAGTRNPVFMLDEVDKIGSDWRGDPSSALLEVLDPAQNHAFRDHYLDVDFDLSDVIFITTANQLGTIPAPLRDRMEILQLDGYTDYEKIRIAQKHLVPRQIKANGLTEDEITFTDASLHKIVQDYTREAGVRNLERQIGTICRKNAVKISTEGWTHVLVTPELVRDYLKKEKFESESREHIEIPGIATGLAVTPFGGEILFVEASRMKGKGNLTLTGQLGDVMRESAQIAHSWVRSKADRLGVDPEQFERADIHLHVPAGATPKDGPSAGIAMVMAVASLFSAKPVRGDVGMTGEVTLRGRVLPVGGIKMKVLAAYRAGLSTVILPRRNEKDLEDLPDEVRNTMLFMLVDTIDEALTSAFVTAREPMGAV